MRWKRQIGGILSLAGLALMVGAAGWWWLTRGEVIDRVELFSRTQVAITQSARGVITVGVGNDERGAWKLGPYHLTPEDSPVSITGSFSAAGAQSQRKPDITLKAYLAGENGQQMWDGQSQISWANRDSDAVVSGVELALGMVPIHRPGEYTLYCSTNDEYSRMAGVGTGTMELDMVIRGKAKPFPFIPEIAGFVILLIAVFGFGQKT